MIAGQEVIQGQIHARMARLNAELMPEHTTFSQYPAPPPPPPPSAFVCPRTKKKKKKKKKKKRERQTI